MDYGFAIKGNNGDKISISFKNVYGFPHSTCYPGGYDTEAYIEIKSGSYQIKSTTWITTGELFELYQNFVKCNNLLSGKFNYNSYEHHLSIDIEYDMLGHVSVTGSFQENLFYENILQFEFISDQTYIPETLDSLKNIVEKYGDMNGIKKSDG
jgi:hypothetical protein